MKRKRRLTEIINQRLLAQLLGLKIADLHELAARAQLPFTVRTQTGLEIRADELDAWRVAAKRMAA
jgi:hypothetical protein